MKSQSQIKALAELDGVKFHVGNDGKVWFRDIGERHDYLTSYDAIIPLLQKQTRNVQVRMMKLIAELFGEELGWEVTTQQLCEALLRATGKWKDNERR